MEINTNKYRIVICLFTISITTLNFAQNTEEKDVYIYKKGSYDGIGKWFKGREIAHVMGFQGIRWLERVEREKEENTSTLIQNMNIQKADVVADIGAGSGYHVFKIAPLAVNGQVYAVDIQKEMLVEIERKKKFNSVNNIQTVQRNEKNIKLIKNSIDKVLMVDVYHEFSFPMEMLESIKNSMKPEGKLFLIEYRGEDDSVPIKKLHKMTEKQAVRELESVGFKLEKNIDNLPWQHCMVFIKE